ncbi:hypothetical protein J6590_089567 [Homalodisca vitripennis]|nr:hypothetical protein J6590_089567 [Homalodisca vitripennis]
MPSYRRCLNLCFASSKESIFSSFKVSRAVAGFIDERATYGTSLLSLKTDIGIEVYQGVQYPNTLVEREETRVCYFIARPVLRRDSYYKREDYRIMIELISTHTDGQRDDSTNMKDADGSRRFRTDFLQDLPTPGTGPSFDTSILSNLTGLVGKTAYFNCRVKNLGNRTEDCKLQIDVIKSDVTTVQVSWDRHRDIHLLTVGRYTYTSDQRFEADTISQKKDTGIYECQISTTPPIGHHVYLNVVEPITDILGGPELFINKRSTINLTCLVRFAPEPPPVMIWSHNREVINFDSPRGGVSLLTEKGIITTSRLLIQNAVHTDNGVYTCDPSNANSASIRVHILNGEHPAAMHHGGSSRSSPPLLSALLISWLLQLIM